jgi:hypothetical protein
MRIDSLQCAVCSALAARAADPERIGLALFGRDFVAGVPALPILLIGEVIAAVPTASDDNDRT